MSIFDLAETSLDGSTQLFTISVSEQGPVGPAGSLVLGETSLTAYRGDRGKTAYDHSQLSGNPHATNFLDLLGTVAVGQLPLDVARKSQNNNFLTDQNITGNFGISGDARITGRLFFGGVPNSEAGELSSNLTEAYLTANQIGGQLVFRSNVSGVMTERFRTNTTGLAVTGNITASGNINFGSSSGFLREQSGECIAGSDASGFYFANGYALADKTVYIGRDSNTYQTILNQRILAKRGVTVVGLISTDSIAVTGSITASGTGTFGVAGGSLVLGTATTNTRAVVLDGYFSNFVGGGAVSIINRNFGSNPLITLGSTAYPLAIFNAGTLSAYITPSGDLTAGNITASGTYTGTGVISQTASNGQYMRLNVDPAGIYSYPKLQTNSDSLSIITTAQQLVMGGTYYQFRNGLIASLDLPSSYGAAGAVFRRASATGGGNLAEFYDYGNILKVSIGETGNIIASGTVTSVFQSLTTDPTTLDLTSGQTRTIKNTTTGTSKIWLNDSGTMRSVTFV